MRVERADLRPGDVVEYCERYRVTQEGGLHPVEGHQSYYRRLSGRPRVRVVKGKPGLFRVVYGFTPDGKGRTRFISGLPDAVGWADEQAKLGVTDLLGCTR